jgi:hypothetical protein
MESEPARCVGLSEVIMHEAFDSNIRQLVAAINAFDGLTVIGGCGGHPDPQSDQWPEGSWHVMFTVQRTDQGWLALKFLAWAINNDYRRGGHQVLLSPIAPPPFLNQPGQALQFVIEGDASASAPTLAPWLNQLRTECYVAPWKGRITTRQQADRFGGVLQGG